MEETCFFQGEGCLEGSMDMRLGDVEKWAGMAEKRANKLKKKSGTVMNCLTKKDQDKVINDQSPFSLPMVPRPH